MEDAKSQMQSQKIFYAVAAWSFILLGLGHTVSHLSFMFFATPKPSAVIAMQESITPELGRSQLTLLSLHNGYGLMMGILLVAVGVMNLFIPSIDSDFPKRSRSITVFNIGIAAITMLISIKFFFAIPILFSGIALIFYSLTMLKGQQQTA